MRIDDIGLAFPAECFRAALLVSLLSVWVLVGLFYYLYRFAKRSDFRIWTGAWLFYAIWLTLSFGSGDAKAGTILFTLNQGCVAVSAAFLLWGSLRCLNIPVPVRLGSVIGLFLAAWILISPEMMKDPLQIHLPVFILLGLSSPFAGVCFLRLQRQKSFVGVAMLSLGFLLWVIYIGSYPFPHSSGRLHEVGFCLAAILQVIIAVSMVMVLMQEVQRESEAVRAEIEAVRLEQTKLLSTKEACQALFNRLRAAEENEKAVAEMRKARRAVVEREHLEALGKMAGDVAHDINNALSPITAYSELLLNTMPDLPVVSRQRLERIGKAAEEVAGIVASLREFYRPELEGKSPSHPAVLPVIAPSVQPALEPGQKSALESCRPLRILCIDDEPQVRQVLHDVLELEHHKVTIATNGQEGLNIFLDSLRADEPYEVVITDLGMPDVDGKHVARAIKAESPKTPIIMLTGWGSMMNANDENAPAVDAVLGKPPRMQELADVLFRITARSAT